MGYTLETHDDLIMLILYDNDDEQNGVKADDETIFSGKYGIMTFRQFFVSFQMRKWVFWPQLGLSHLLPVTNGETEVGFQLRCKIHLLKRLGTWVCSVV